MDWENIEHLADELAVPFGNLGPIARPRRIASITEAVLFPSGSSIEERVYTQLYGPFQDTSVAVGKPGKEANPDRKNPNLNDMTPSLLLGGQDIGYRPSFGDVFSGIQEFASAAGGSGSTALQVMGALFFRNAYMLDHIEIEPGIWRYRPPEASISYLEAANPLIGEVPVRTLLHLIEALALNEDVKYNPPGDSIDASGRSSNTSP